MIKVNCGRCLRQLLWRGVFAVALLALPFPLWAADWSPLSDTGQNKCYDAQGAEIVCPTAGQPFLGQDAQYQGATSVFRDNGNQTVSDQQSGLMWMKSSDDIARRWQDAITYCNERVFAGHDDWRLPSKFELESIVNYGRSFPAVNEVFSCPGSFTWSKTVHVGNPEYAWSVYCDDGADHWVHKTNTYSVRCVRNER
ncbi:Protein of unknown function (DUF1566) [Desulfocapsa sulfexigens DSM 10523]|uniref:Lcl C-terminal domain-containing protein n=1 Tax=Desulfocapsa sulfexigens (strain DSM 10523 / SB164P1) TaxID=1167006 RepID=M1P4N0_DESSD|nr:DUF1566 domain-containing protein [Desulfocapsa sulfexigens]AGF76657.1 Protein of unknown function (DUF1566) [Desulfocapsa sulfexigens DSM 10523]